MTPLECGNVIKRELQRCNTICREYFRWRAYKLDLAWSVRGTCAGKALRDQRVRFNLLLLMEQPEDQVRFVAAHEFAHIAVYKRWATEIITDFKHQLQQEISLDEVSLLAMHEDQRPQAHGAEWRRMMLLFGYPPKRCHSFDVTRHRLR